MNKKKKRPRLTINGHTDCIIIGNAVADYCRRMADEYHAYALKLLKEGKDEEAQKFFRYANESTQCGIRTERRLRAIQQRLEMEMDWQSYGSGHTNGCPGDVAARDSF